MTTEVAERVTVAAPPDAVYALIADPRRMARLSPECFAVWVTRRRDGRADRFVGWNRRGPFVWFTTCRVVTAVPGREFTFDVTSFGQPVSRWGYRLAQVGGGTEVTEYWEDHRNTVTRRLGRVFTGRVATRRPEANRDGMRATLARVQQKFPQRS
jgi:uncharacterized protein YndB with AHSA1/START domain